MCLMFKIWLYTSSKENRCQHVFVAHPQSPVIWCCKVVRSVSMFSVSSAKLATESAVQRNDLCSAFFLCQVPILSVLSRLLVADEPSVTALVQVKVACTEATPSSPLITRGCCCAALLLLLPLILARTFASLSYCCYCLSSSSPWPAPPHIGFL